VSPSLYNNGGQNCCRRDDAQNVKTKKCSVVATARCKTATATTTMVFKRAALPVILVYVYGMRSWVAETYEFLPF
jgi:hypothetical protein